MQAALQREVEKYNQKNDKKAQLSFSYGYDVFKMSASTYLEECIKVTDEKMYESKKQKKLARAEKLKES